MTGKLELNKRIARILNLNLLVDSQVTAEDLKLLKKWNRQMSVGLEEHADMISGWCYYRIWVLCVPAT